MLVILLIQTCVVYVTTTLLRAGKYVPDVTQPDPKRWKANFRCAINSLSDVHEEPAQSCKKGHNAYKVYRFDADKRLAKKRSCSSNGQTAVVNADRRELTKAKRMKRECIKVYHAVSVIINNNIYMLK